MDRHHPHGVVVVLGQDRVGHSTLGGLQFRPLQIAADAMAAGVGPGPGLFDDVTDSPPHVAPVGTGQREVEHPSIVDDRSEQIGGRVPADAFGDRAHMGDGCGHGVIVEAGGNGRPRIPRAALTLPRPELDVAAPVERAAKRLDHHQFVGRVVGGPEHHHQRADLGGGIDDRGVLGAVCESGAAQLGFERRQRDASGQQDADVARPTRTQRAECVIVDGPAVGERRRHRGGNIGRLTESEGVGGAHVAGAAVRCEVVVAFGAEHRHRAVGQGGRGTTRIERMVGRLGIGLECDQPTEDVVGEVDHGLCRAEIGRQRNTVGADLVGRPQVLGDVGSPEAVDRLLGVADDEQAAGKRMQPSPRRYAGAVG